MEKKQSEKERENKVLHIVAQIVAHCSSSCCTLLFKLLHIVPDETLLLYFVLYIFRLLRRQERTGKEKEMENRISCCTLLFKLLHIVVQVVAHCYSSCCTLFLKRLSFSISFSDSTLTPNPNPNSVSILFRVKTFNCLRR